VAVLLALTLPARLLHHVPGLRLSIGTRGAAAWGLAAWLGWLPPGFAAVLLGIAAILGIVSVRRVQRLAPRHPAPWLLLAAGAAIHGTFAFTVPTNYDFLSYHLPLAQRYAEAFRGEWRNFYAGMPLGVPALHRLLPSPTWAAVAVANAVPFVAAASCVMAIARRLGATPAMQVAGGALWLGLPLARDASLQHLSDGWVALFGLAALEAALLAGDRRGPAAAIAAGALAASAVAAKLSSFGVVLVPVAAVLAWLVPARVGMRAAVRPLLLAGAASAAVIAPWCARAYVLQADRTLAPVTWTAEQRAFVVRAHRPQRPWEAAFWETAARKLPRLAPSLAPSGDASAFRAASALAAWAMAAGAAVGSRRGRVLFLAALLGAASWLLLRDNPDRFALPLSGVVIALAASAIPDGGRVAEGPGRLLALLGGGFLCLAALLGVATAAVTAARLPLVTRHEQLVPALAQNLGPDYIAAIRDATQRAGRGRLLVLFDARTALYPPTASVTTVWDRWAWPICDTPEETTRALLRDGYHMVFANEFEFGRLLDFYSATRFREPRWRAAGVHSPGFGEELAAYPSLPPGKASSVAAWLRDRRAAARQPRRGDGSEIWLAPISASAETPRP
jgi:hypothetical protein